MGDVVAHNRRAWDREVERGNEWSRPVSPEVVAKARAGQWSIVLIGYEPVDPTWFPPDIAARDVLCLASGGGQQGPVLAAAGARVTVFDNSPRQLAQDDMVAEREGLDLRTVLGDARDLSAFADATFDLVVHPVSNLFIPELAPVWQECHRVLRPGGTLLSGFVNPDVYLFDADALDTRGELGPTPVVRDGRLAARLLRHQGRQARVDSLQTYPGPRQSPTAAPAGDRSGRRLASARRNPRPPLPSPRCKTRARQHPGRQRLGVDGKAVDLLASMRPPTIVIPTAARNGRNAQVSPHPR